MATWTLPPGEHQYKKDGDACPKFKKRTSKRYEDLVLWAFLWHYLLSYFSAQYPKRYCKSSHGKTFEAKHPKRYQNLFLTLRRYDEHPRHFFMGVYRPHPLWAWTEKSNCSLLASCRQGEFSLYVCVEEWKLRSNLH